MTDPVRVVLADDHAVIRSGIRTALADRGFEVVAEAADASQAISAALKHRPDICLLDLYMPGNGVDAARRIKSVLPRCLVVMLTVSDSTRDLFEALRVGADGYLLKTMAADRLPDALLLALSGEAVVPRSLMARVVSELDSLPLRAVPPSLGGSRSPIIAPLSQRELEVLGLLLEGLTTSAIAMRLGISDVTVRRHVSAIVRVSGAPDRRSAINLLRHELESAEEPS
jgi:DNA-binding NarL/FixJ family response regulator